MSVSSLQERSKVLQGAPLISSLQVLVDSGPPGLCLLLPQFRLMDIAYKSWDELTDLHPSADLSVSSTVSKGGMQSIPGKIRRGKIK